MLKRIIIALLANPSLWDFSMPDLDPYFHASAGSAVRCSPLPTRKTQCMSCSGYGCDACWGTGLRAVRLAVTDSSVTVERPYTAKRLGGSYLGILAILGDAFAASHRRGDALTHEVAGAIHGSTIASLTGGAL